jgi:hypothetical protein
MRRIYDYGHEQPYRLAHTPPLYATLRSEEPVARVSTPDGGDGWQVTRYECVKAVPHDSSPGRAAAVEQADRLLRASAHVPACTDPRAPPAARDRFVGWRPAKPHDGFVEDDLAAGPGPKRAVAPARLSPTAAPADGPGLAVHPAHRQTLIIGGRTEVMWSQSHAA